MWAKAYYRKQLDKALKTATVSSFIHGFLFIYLFSLSRVTFLSVFIMLPGIRSGVNSSSSAGDRKIFWLRAYKSPMIAAHPRARYSPDTEIVAMATLTAGQRQAQYNTKEAESGSGRVAYPFDNKKCKHAIALWLMSITDWNQHRSQRHMHPHKLPTPT